MICLGPTPTIAAVLKVTVALVAVSDATDLLRYIGAWTCRVSLVRLCRLLLVSGRLIRRRLKGLTVVSALVLVWAHVRPVLARSRTFG